MDRHVSVLLNEAIDGLNIKPDGIYVDMTLGRGGHSSEILKRLNKNGLLISFDLDRTAIDESVERLNAIGDNFKIIHDNFVNIKERLLELGISDVDGVLMDLGASSPQFDDTERGFSYRGSAKLDMRMNVEQKLTAMEIVNTYSLNDLTKIFREYGEEKFAYQIAREIVRARDIKPIELTSELVDIIKLAKPAKELAKKGHPAKQIFQALRIEVNDELNNLTKALNDSMAMLKHGGRLVVITFHSLEDRIVKQTFKSVSIIEGTRHGIIALPNEEETKFSVASNKPILPSDEELEFNHRSKSAKMRILIRK